MIMTYPCFVILTAGRISFTKKQMLRCRQDDIVKERVIILFFRQLL